MPRTARLVIPDVSLHVVQRGHDRAACFFEDADYVAYLVALGTYAARFQCFIHAYCLMTNHVHLLLTPTDSTGCALMMKHLAQRHSRRINAKHQRTGTLWEGRFYSGLVADERYALACYRYIELNPVRAGMVGLPDAYRWSSHRANVHADPQGFIKPHPAILALGTEHELRLTAYRALCLEPLQNDVIDEIRRATRSGHRMGASRKPRGRPKRLGAGENGDCHQLEMVTVTI
ncbi:MAG TPA: transposase [Burkholderiales bacterium]